MSDKLLISDNESTGEEMNDDAIDITLNPENLNEISRNNVTKALKTRRESRAQLRNVVIKEQEEGIRLTLKAIAGKDTDWGITRQIIREATNLCNSTEDPKFRLFVGGDQKTMGLVLRLKKQYPDEFKHVHVSTPDLHLRKSMLHVVLKRYGPLGLAHLAFLATYKAPEQRKYLEDIVSIPKSFAFAERIYYTFQLCFCFEFLRSLTPEDKDSIANFVKTPSNKVSHHQKYQEYIKKGSEDLVWRKNYELMTNLEIIIGHYMTERCRDYDLRTACIKEFIPFSVVSNCTAYDPLLTELIYHQATFQPKYKDLIRRYFSYPISESKSETVYVGWDAIAEDTNLKCGRFRHKRQSLEQSTIQSQIVETMNEELTSMEKISCTKNV